MISYRSSLRFIHWPNFKVQGPKIIELEQNVNLIRNSSLYTHIPKIKSISPSTAKKSGLSPLFFAMLGDIDLIFGT
jgi:hypothetical protein